MSNRMVPRFLSVGLKMMPLCNNSSPAFRRLLWCLYSLRCFEATAGGYFDIMFSKKAMISVMNVSIACELLRGGVNAGLGILNGDAT
jgi:hypothetical protein